MVTTPGMMVTHAQNMTCMVNSPKDRTWVELGGAWAVYWPETHPCVSAENKRDPWVVFFDSNSGGYVEYAATKDIMERLEERNAE